MRKELRSPPPARPSLLAGLRSAPVRRAPAARSKDRIHPQAVARAVSDLAKRESLVDQTAKQSEARRNGV
jgi:hypothetical protein